MKKRIHSELLLPLTAAVLLHCLGYLLTKPLTAGRVHLNMAIPADSLVPVLPWTVSIYIGAYLFWVICYYRICSGEKDRAIHFLAADILCMSITTLCYLLFPATLARPTPGESFWGRAMLLLYSLDTPDNLFPSAHCSLSWICFRAAACGRQVSRTCRSAALVCCLLICCSTLTVRQHVLADVLGGILLAELCWQAARTHAVSGSFRRLFRMGE